MLQKLISLSLVLGVAFAARSANQYIDNVIQSSLPSNLRDLGLDPVALSNFSTRFGTQSVYQPQGEATFSNGNASGLGRIRRKGDCTGPKMFKGELSINCTLSIFPISLSYSVSARNGSYYYPARAGGSVDETLVYLEVTGRPQNYIGSVNKFQLLKLGMINPAINGLPTSLNTYMKVLFDAYRAHISSELFNIFQQRYSYALGRALAYKPMPRQ